MSESYELDRGAQPRCTQCGNSLAEGAVLCVRCGTDQRTGHRSKVHVETVAPTQMKKPKAKPEAFGEVCAQCGYDMTTLPGRPCPECGHSKKKSAAREERRQAVMKEYWRNTYLTGIIGTVVGSTATVALAMMVLSASPLDAMFYVFICIACIQIAYFGLCLMWLGFEDTVLGSAIRITAVGAVWSALLLIGAIIPLPTMGGLIVKSFITVFCVAVPLKVLVDREWYECNIIGVAALVLRILVLCATGY